MKIRLELAGAPEASTFLNEAGARLDQPARPLLETLAAEMQSLFGTHIREERGPDGSWPELANATHFIRAWYGHPAASPKLVRAGDLLHSIQPLALGDDYVETGTEVSYAGVVNDGGEVTDAHGRTRTVQAFPFLWLDEQEISDLMTMISEYFFGGERAAA